jgi:hypothetical protein
VSMTETHIDQIITTLQNLAAARHSGQVTLVLAMSDGGIRTARVVMEAMIIGGKKEKPAGVAG